jgi:hypothetical protein
MNDIFNTDVPLKNETPAFAKHVLPAVPLSNVDLFGNVVTDKKNLSDDTKYPIPNETGFSMSIEDAKQLHAWLGVVLNGS